MKNATLNVQGPEEIGKARIRTRDLFESRSWLSLERHLGLAENRQFALHRRVLTSFLRHATNGCWDWWKTRCKAAGGHAIAIVTDVAKPEQLDRLAEEAMAWQGCIDTWINDAAVSEYANFVEMDRRGDRAHRACEPSWNHSRLSRHPSPLFHMRRQGYGTPKCKPLDHRRDEPN